MNPIAVYLTWSIYLQYMSGAGYVDEHIAKKKRRTKGSAVFGRGSAPPLNQQGEVLLSALLGMVHAPPHSGYDKEMINARPPPASNYIY